MSASDSSSPTPSTPDREIIQITLDGLADGSIGLFPTQNSNGPDYYTCPFCRRTTDVVGHIGSMERLDQGEHDPECPGMRLFTLAQTQQE